MKISVILAHPRPGSFNHAIVDEAADMLRKSGHTVTVHDLYQEKFDPLLPYDEIPRPPRRLPCTVLRLQQRTVLCSSIPTGGECRLQS